MVYVSNAKENIEKYIKLHPELKIEYVKELKTYNAKKTAQEMDIKLHNYATDNTILLDYFNPGYITFITDEGEIFNFREKFSDELKYMYPGEILLNFLNASI